VPVSADFAALGLPPRRWADLRRRLLSVAVLVPPVVFAIVMGGFVWIALVVVSGAILVWEWGRLCRAPAARSPGPPVAAFWLPFGVVWLAAAAAALLSLRLDVATGFADTLFLCLVVASTDVGAYVFGRRLGGPRLAPKISPNKTWSGVVGGLLTAMAVGGAAGYALAPAGLASGRVVAGAVSVAALLGVLAVLGDLFESWMKRRCDVKDTSGLIPGHGGLLDRLDGLLAAAPAAALLAYAAPNGLPLWVFG